MSSICVHGVSDFFFTYVIRNGPECSREPHISLSLSVCLSVCPHVCLCWNHYEIVINKCRLAIIMHCRLGLYLCKVQIVTEYRIHLDSGATITRTAVKSLLITQMVLCATECKLYLNFIVWNWNELPGCSRTPSVGFLIAGFPEMCWFFRGNIAGKFKIVNVRRMGGPPMIINRLLFSKTVGFREKFVFKICLAKRSNGWSTYLRRHLLTGRLVIADFLSNGWL